VGELPSSGMIGAVRARELLDDVAGLRRRVRRPVGLWPPLVVFGTVAVVGAPFGMLGGLATAVWWLTAGPVAFVAVGRLSYRHAHRRGIDGPSRLLWVLGIVSFAAVWLACFWISGAAHLPRGLAWTLAVAVGYLGWSRFARSWPVAAVAVGLGIVGTALALSPAPTWTVQLGVGAVMTAGGLLIRHGPEAP
jgi:hypothetical protein